MGPSTMQGLRKFLDDLAEELEQPIEPELKTASNKQRDKEIKYAAATM